MVKKAFRLIRDFYLFFVRGWKVGQFGGYAKAFCSSFLEHLNVFRHSLKEGDLGISSIHDEKVVKLKAVSVGLHALLPPEDRFTYSILIAADLPNPSYFKTCLRSALDQSSPSIEVLVGFSSVPCPEIGRIVDELRAEFPSLCTFDMSKEGDSSGILFLLAQRATGHYLLLMGDEEWIRPDMLLRYEQVLRAIEDPEKAVLHCDFRRLNQLNGFNPFNEFDRNQSITFPYFFRPFAAKGLLVSSPLWNKIPRHSLCKGAEDEDMLMRLELAGARFIHVPFSFYGVRSDPYENKSGKAFLQVTEKYAKEKGLPWKWSEGYLKGTLRALPPLPENRTILAVIPFKDQKELTLKCTNSLLKQRDVDLKITAIDNRSHDQSIAHELRQLGVDVITLDEPFNYSRMNNFAVKHSKWIEDCTAILFVNNDVELEMDALSEMLRWIDQPRIGIVGCRLNYPDGRLQHGGVRLNRHLCKEMRWEHIEKLRSFQDLEDAKVLGIFDAVTAACALVKRSVFLEVGGFDETWYPIGYSDTNLAVKLASIGLECFYTPYACGVHHESVSRKTCIEDFENSYWLQDLWLQKFAESAPKKIFK